ncbi:MAG: hypothetical protein Q8O10_05785 [candidate division Zixibacteria bacterium]|nr:hypothetical protein [candidate division Zixibacteria bacterium]
MVNPPCPQGGTTTHLEGNMGTGFSVNMTKTKKTILIIWFLLIALFCTIPPWKCDIRIERHNIYTCAAHYGYHPIWWEGDRPYQEGNIFLEVLILEMIIATAL